MSGMARLEFGRLSAAWQGEASTFTPLLATQLDALGAALGLDLASVGETEVATAGGRRIDIVAQDADGTEFVIENQYGRADHDHLTRGLAYAVASHAKGLVVVAEEHRDEFRAVATYLNDLAELDPDRGISVWLVEVQAVRIAGSPWAPLFTAVVEPNDFTANVEQAKLQHPGRLASIDDFYAGLGETTTAEAAKMVIDGWMDAGHRIRLGPDHVVLEAAGPAVSGIRSVIALYTHGGVLVPFSSYAGQNSGVAIETLGTPAFRSNANVLFGFSGSEQQARTGPGWLSGESAPKLLKFALGVADAYATALASTGPGDVTQRDTDAMPPMRVADACTPASDPSQT